MAQFDEPGPSSSDDFDKAKGLATGVIIAIIVGEFRSSALCRTELKLALKV